jgi:hypothetical protein
MTGEEEEEIYSRGRNRKGIWIEKRKGTDVESK